MAGLVNWRAIPVVAHEVVRRQRLVRILCTHVVSVFGRWLVKHFKRKKKRRDIRAGPGWLSRGWALSE